MKLSMKSVRDVLLPEVPRTDDETAILQWRKAHISLLRDAHSALYQDLRVLYDGLDNDVGWTKLPNGLLVQWGTGTQQSGAVNVSFPKAFSSTVYVVLATAQGDGPAIVVEDKGVRTLSTAKFRIFNLSGTTPNDLTCDWLAIGT